MIFQYKEYKKFITHLKKFGTVVPLKKWESAKAIVLRHDVDFDLDAAYQLALIESECGVASTFFFLTTCDTYNLFSAKNRLILQKIEKLGFEIGLHFDPTIYGDVSEEELALFLDHESAMLAQLIEGSIDSVSLHNPSVHGQFPIFENYNNAYDQRIFSDTIYLADSRMDFRGKSPYSFIENNQQFPIQVLLHPLHYAEEVRTYPEIFSENIKKYISTIEQTFQVNSTYNSQIENDTLLSYFINKSNL